MLIALGHDDYENAVWDIDEEELTAIDDADQILE